MIPFQLHRRIPLIRRPFWQRDQARDKVNRLGDRVMALDECIVERDAIIDSLRAQLVAQEEKSKGTVLDVYVSEPPSRDRAFRIFDGLWSSHVPGYGHGTANLFDDHRVRWFAEQCGGFEGKRILELGPLEGAHTYMLAQGGAASITSIESNTTAFLKCLIVQNTLKFNANFLLGDFRPYLDTCTDTYDLVMASGVLYHMIEPIKLLQDLAKTGRSLAIWTHYYDAKIIADRDEGFRKKFLTTPRIEHAGSRKIKLYQQIYLAALEWQGFCGGSAPISYWMEKGDIIGLLSDVGFKVAVGEDTWQHPNGPAMTLFASRP